MKNIILRYFTLHLKNSLERSQYFASKRKEQKIVNLADLLKAISWENGCVGFNILKNLKTFPILRGSMPQTVALKGKIQLEPVDFSEAAHRAIISAIRVAQEYQFPYVGTEHLLFAVLENGDKKTLALLGKDKAELARLHEQIRKVMAGTNEPIIEEPLFFVNFPKKIQKKGAVTKNPKNAQSDFIQEVMGEIGELFSSIVEKKKKEETEMSSSNFFQYPPPRPSFGLVMPRVQNLPNLPKTEQLLEYFGHDLNEEIVRGKIDPIVGRDKEIDDLVCILMRKTKNNPVLVGEPGVGKTAIVAGLAKKIVEKEVPPMLLGKRIITLDMGLLVAGTSFRGEFEDRFKRVLEEAESDPNVILFIDELHNLVGAGSAQGSLDAANIMKPALARGLLRCIGATTIEEYNHYIEKDGALERRFQSVWVKEPSLKETLTILKGIRRFYEEHHNVKISNQALLESVRLANRFIPDRFLPDKAIDLLDESAAFVVQDEHRQGTTKKLQKLEMQREKLRQAKERMVRNNNMEMAANILKSEKDLAKIIRELEVKVAKERRLIPVVDERDVAEVLSRKLRLPLELVLESPAERLKNLPQLLMRSLKGQDRVVQEVAATLRRSLAGIADPERPATALLFVGPTGVGKTYLAKLIARELFLKADSIIRVDMSEFSEKHTVSRLLGSPPGYVGYGERNGFTDKIRKNPYSLILFDEIEKAHPEVFHVFLQVLEDGFLTDGTGRKINFRNTIIVFTSNLGNDEFLKEMMGFSGTGTTSKLGKREKAGIRKKLEDFLRPEFLNRVSGVAFFKPLGIKEIQEIAVLEIDKLKKRLLATKKINLAVDKAVLKELASRSVDKKEGVRMLRRLIQQKIEEPIAQKIFDGKLEKGTTVSFRLNKKTGGKFRMSLTLKPKPDIYAEKKTEPMYTGQKVGIGK